MPASPLHFLAVASLHFKWPERFDISALLFSSILIDLEFLFYLFTGQPIYHGVWHSYFFALTMFPVVLSFFTYLIERSLCRVIQKVHRFFRFYPERVKYPLATIYFSCLIGGFTHVFFDMWVHKVSPYVLFPFLVFNSSNPFWIGEYALWIHVGVGLLSLYTIYLWIKRMPSGQ
jgi:hypothetical protein